MPPLPVPAKYRQVPPPLETTGAGGPPMKLLAPDVHLIAPIVAVGNSGGTLGVPDDVHTLGWWRSGAVAGSPEGTIVIDGHVDSAGYVDSAGQGIGALATIATMQPGQRLTLTTGSGPVSYLVQARRTYRKNQLPTELFTTTGPAQLALITCGGPFNTTSKHYRDNIVVYATPTMSATQPR